MDSTFNVREIRIIDDGLPTEQGGGWEAFVLCDIPTDGPHTVEGWYAYKSKPGESSFPTVSKAINSMKFLTEWERRSPDGSDPMPWRKDLENLHEIFQGVLWQQKMSEGWDLACKTIANWCLVMAHEEPQNKEVYSKAAEVISSMQPVFALGEDDTASN